VQGYLLDTNHVSAYYNQEPNVIQKLSSIPADWQIRVCSITLGEIQAGHRLTRTTNQRKRDDFWHFVNDNFAHNELIISIHTGYYYAQILGGIWQHYPPNPGIETEAHLVRLGVDINDVWITAAAWEHNITFVTRDRMTIIRQAVGGNVRFECWI
jgi:predicted nucleic acid-binding protein